MSKLNFALDTREKRGFNNGDFTRATFPVGDIGIFKEIDGQIFLYPFVVERKLKGDFMSCLKSNRERFEREVMKAQYLTWKFIVVVEGRLDECLKIRCGKKFSYTSKRMIESTIKAWKKRYPNLFFVFTTKPEEVIKKFLQTCYNNYSKEKFITALQDRLVKAEKNIKELQERNKKKYSKYIKLLTEMVEKTEEVLRVAENNKYKFL